jgi:hypothetical protein
MTDANGKVEAWLERARQRAAEREREARKREVLYMRQDGRVQIPAGSLYPGADSSRIYWSKQGNTYCIVPVDRQGTGWMRTYGHAWTTEDGQRVMLLSINGCGEIRWSIGHHAGKVSPSTSGDADAAAWFFLTPIED